MRRLLMAAIATMVVVVAAPAAQADHGEGHFIDDFNGVTWPDSPSVGLCLSSEWANSLGPQAYDNAVDTMQHDFNTWRNATDFNTIFGVGGGCSQGNIGFRTAWNNVDGYGPSFCSNRDSQNDPSSIQYESLDNLDGIGLNVLGIVVICDFNNDAGDHIDHAYMAINADFGQGGGLDRIHFDWSTSPDSDEWDFDGIFLHEFGHVIGFDVHLMESCPLNSTRGTMCGGDYGHSNGRQFTASLEQIDKTVVNNTY